MEKAAVLSYAELAHKALIEKFWNAEESIFSPSRSYGPGENFCYWWQAHAMDVLIDRYLRTGDRDCLKRLREGLAGVTRRNGGTLYNNWYDDMEWMALMLLRLWDVTREEEIKELVYALWRDIQTAWNGHMGGGMAWRKDQLDYKNTPANAPAAILAFGLYGRFGDAGDLAWGEKIYTWNRDNLMDPETYYVWDGVNREGDGKIDYDWAYTYCQGTLLGAAVEYFRVTGDREHLQVAHRIALGSKRRFHDAHGGVMPYEGKEDCGLFRGIFFRYLNELLAEMPEEEELRGMVRANADALTAKGMDADGLIGGDWTQRPEGDADLAQHLSGVMLLEMAAKLV